MPHLFFHLCHEDDVLLDDEGRDIEDHDAMLRVTLAEARGMIGGEAIEGRIMLDHRIDVVDAGGALVHRLEFIDAVILALPTGWRCDRQVPILFCPTAPNMR